ncbi:MAG TPA: hypothetical protein VNI61_09015, partial [Gemmatimonadales bacterium]|nr:hypothetical protein [Gemmatimonadales bacterium]
MLLPGLVAILGAAQQAPAQQPPQLTPSPIAEVIVTPNGGTLVPGDTLRLSAEARDSAGRPVPNARIRFFAGGGFFEGSVDTT